MQRQGGSSATEARQACLVESYLATKGYERTLKAFNA